MYIIYMKFGIYKDYIDKLFTGDFFLSLLKI